MNLVKFDRRIRRLGERLSAAERALAWYEEHDVEIRANLGESEHRFQLACRIAAVHGLRSELAAFIEAKRRAVRRPWTDPPQDGTMFS